MAFFILLSLFIHIYTYDDITAKSDWTTGYPVLVIDKPSLGVHIFLTPEGTLINLETLPDALIISPAPYETCPARWGYISHLFKNSPPILIVFSYHLKRIMLAIGVYTTLF